MHNVEMQPYFFTGAHAMAFNLVFNMSLLYGFFGVFSGSKKSRTD